MVGFETSLCSSRARTGSQKSVHLASTLYFLKDVKNIINFLLIQVFLIGINNDIFKQFFYLEGI